MGMLRGSAPSFVHLAFDDVCFKMYYRSVFEPMYLPALIIYFTDILGLCAFEEARVHIECSDIDICP